MLRTIEAIYIVRFNKSENIDKEKEVMYFCTKPKMLNKT